MYMMSYKRAGTMVSKPDFTSNMFRQCCSTPHHSVHLNIRSKSIILINRVRLWIYSKFGIVPAGILYSLYRYMFVYLHPVAKGKVDVWVLVPRFRKNARIVPWVFGEAKIQKTCGAAWSREACAWKAISKQFTKPEWPCRAYRGLHFKIYSKYMSHDSRTYHFYFLHREVDV